jgi:hypothetical protein
MRLWTMACAAAIAAVLFAERPCPAMSASDLTANTWAGQIESSIRVIRLGRDTGDTTSEVTFTETGTNAGAYSAVEDDQGTPRTYTGTWRIRGHGRRLLSRLDADGRDALAASLSNWVGEMASDAGIEFGSLRIARAIFLPSRLPGTRDDFSVRLRATGRATGTRSGRRVGSVFQYASTSRLTPN